MAEHFNNKNFKCTAFLMSTDYNKTLQSSPNVKRIDSFKDFANKLKEFGININL